MAIQCFIVGTGGALGAVFRYLLSFVKVGTNFPFMTFFTNIAGAIVIGVIAALAERSEAAPGIVLFLKTGVCGGFTTFSTFSLETLTLIEEKHAVTACLYAGTSVVLCIAGVWIGRWVICRLI